MTVSWDDRPTNIAFDVLGLPYYYRKGGASIISLHDRESRKGLPAYVRRSPEIHLGHDRGSLVTT